MQKVKPKATRQNRSRPLFVPAVLFDAQPLCLFRNCMDGTEIIQRYYKILPLDLGHIEQGTHAVSVFSETAYYFEQIFISVCHR